MGRGSAADESPPSAARGVLSADGFPNGSAASAALPMSGEVPHIEMLSPDAGVSSQSMPSRLPENFGRSRTFAPSKGSVLRQPRQFSPSSSLSGGTLAEKCWNFQKVRAMVESTQFELLFACLILCNALTMSVEGEFLGIDLGYTCGYDQGQPMQKGAKVAFTVVELIFGSVFALEVVLKIYGMRLDFFKSFWNWFDAFIIGFWLVDALGNVQLFVINPMILRLARLMRLLRLLRLVRTIQMFDVLHLIVASLKASTYVLLWSIVLLFVIMLTLSMLMSFAIEPYVLDTETNSAENRHRAYLYFGTVSKAFVSMFEITMGNWVPMSRFLFEQVNAWYGLAMIAYRCVVGFAIIQVITGVFMHETFKAAASDDGIMIAQKNRQMMEHMRKMKLLFSEADTSGDGFLSYEEFAEVVHDARVRSWLSAMELDVTDSKLVFDLLIRSNPDSSPPGKQDGELSAEDLVRGVSKLKGSARSLDMATLMMKMGSMDAALQELRYRLPGEPSLPLSNFTCHV
ncbi:unnamed protein product [Polarella glacialis]|nr:unnamed protein product [Polarella glacialis]